MNLRIGAGIVLTMGLATAVFTACSKEAETHPTITAEENTLKIACPPSLQTTVPITALAFFDAWCNSNGRLKSIWQSCYGGGAYPICTDKFGNPRPVSIVNSSVWCVALDDLGIQPSAITYAQQRAIIDYAKAQANAARPTCSAGGLMKLWDLHFCRDTNYPETAICFTASYYCCL